MARVVVERSMNMPPNTMIFYEPTGTIFDYRNFITPRGGEIKNNFQQGYLYVGLSKCAIRYSSASIIEYIELKIQRFIDFKAGVLNYELFRLDQVPIGIVLLDLYVVTKKTIYLMVAQSILKFLEYRFKHDGRLLYMQGANVQHVDALGMYIPFLCEYNKLFQDDFVTEMIQTGFEEYQKYGIDAVSHLPVHGYVLDSKIKVGSSNWGRGLGWYLLAASFYDGFSDSVLDSTLKDLKYTQFLGENSHYDTSTAIMCELYKQSRSNHYDKEPFLHTFVKHISAEGFVMDCSGDTYGYNQYAKAFGSSELTNGLFLLYLSRL
jgi:hypothetical protein